jgi:hypothetical protein
MQFMRVLLVCYYSFLASIVYVVDGKCHTRFERQTECELCTCQDQNSRTQRLHK